MKTIIAGSREIEDYDIVKQACDECGWTITSVVSGTARGVDSLGEFYAHQMGIPVHRFPADWKKFGKAAGHIRNAEMSKNAEALVAIWDGKSAGTRNMIRTAETKGLRVYVKVVTSAHVR